MAKSTSSVVASGSAIVGAGTRPSVSAKTRLSPAELWIFSAQSIAPVAEFQCRRQMPELFDVPSAT